MTLQQTVRFWTYLLERAELKKKAFISTPSGSPYKDEMRTEAETYEWLAKTFVSNFEHSIASAKDFSHGLTAEQAAGFLDYLSEKIVELKAAQEKTESNKQKALAGLQEMEYFRVRGIYKEMVNLEDRQIMAFESARKTFISIHQEG